MIKRIRNLGIKSIAIAGLGIMTFGGWAYANSEKFEISKQVEIFVSIFKKLHTYYVDEINTTDLMQTGIKAMLEELDPYTNYISESDIEDYRMQTTGQYGGIGAVISKKESFIQIIEPHKGFPAYKADIRAGDIIKKVGDKSVEGKSTNEVSQLLKGQPGTDVTVTIERPGKDSLMVKNLTREEVQMPNVTYSGTLNGENIGYIKFENFRQNASQEVKKAFQNLKDENDNLEGLILDLRGNPGGILQEAVKTVGLFVEKGKLVVSTKGKIDDWNKKYKTKNAPVDKNMPVTVLVNGSSASASEIVSGALQDYDRGVVVGQQSYGKGLVQQAKSLPYNSKLKLTIAKYYIPSGRCIQARDYSNNEAEEVKDSSEIAFETENGRKVYDAKGITPDVKVNSKDYPKVIENLFRQRHIFDFATLYRNRHDTIPAPKEFEISEEDYQEFKAYLENQDYQYVTQTEKKLDQLKEAADDEKYLNYVEDEIAALKQDLMNHKENDLELHKDEITQILKEEIVKRYYYREGQIRVSLSNDNYVQEAKKVLEDAKRYDDILHVKR